MLAEGRALLDEPLTDEAAFSRWQRQVAQWRTELDAWLDRLRVIVASGRWA